MSMDRLTSHRRRYENFVEPAFRAYDISNTMILQGRGSAEEVERQRQHAFTLVAKAGQELEIVRDIDAESAIKLAEDWRAYGEELQLDPKLIADACGGFPE